MQKQFLFCITALVNTFLFVQSLHAQNTSPFWSLAGNSNATTTSKLGTTNAVNLRFYAGNKLRMMIGATSGNVSIGTTTFGARLTVNAEYGTTSFLGQVGGVTRMKLAANGGLSVGSALQAPDSGLFVAGNATFGTNTLPDGYRLNVEGASLFTGTMIVTNSIIARNDFSDGVNATGNERGVVGHSLGSGIGVWGTSSMVDAGAIGVNGEAYYGVKGVSYSDGGYGVYGYNHRNYGVYGYVLGSTNKVLGRTGVYGYCDSYGYGVVGFARNGIGVYGAGATWAGYFSGNVFASGTYSSSDRTLKQNIADMTTALDVITKLQPKSYTFRQDGNYKQMNLPGGKHYGLIAQDVELVLPELVKSAEFDVRSEGNRSTAKPGETISFKAINYVELIPIMIKGMQEQEAKNKRLEAEVAELRQMVLELKNGRAETLTSIEGSLEQNTPNPVLGSTTIRYRVPEGVTSAVLNITNAKGQIVKTQNISGRGIGQLNFNTQALASGTYNYTLYTDGKPVATKRLVIAR